MIRKEKQAKSRKLWIAAAAPAAALCLTAVLAWRLGMEKETITYEEAAVAKGPLTAGVTEEGTVSVGTVEQTFALDFSRLLSDSSSESESTESGSDGGNSGRNGLSGGLLDFSGMIQQQADGRQLTVEEVYVSAGMEVEEGTAVLKFTEDSVEQIREKLQEDEQNAQILYEKQEASWQRTRQSAQSQLELNQLYGTYASGAYAAQISTLQEALEDAVQEQEALEETLTEEEEQLAGLQEQLEKQEEALANARYVVENSSREESLYWWLVALTSRTQEEETVENLGVQIMTLENTIEENRVLAEEAARSVQQKQEELESGMAEASATKQVRSVQADNAREIYEVTMELAEFEKNEALETYEEASARLSEFDSYIRENKVYAAIDGVVTEVGVEAGAAVSKEDELLIGLNSYEDVTVTVTVQEADMDSAQTGAKANLSFSAFPEENFTGTVKEVGDAQIDSSTNSTTYEVAVSVDGGDSRFYEGMSAEVTFLKQDSQEALAVPRQAVYQKGENTFVLVKTEEGGSEKRQVVTGRQDGVSVEIIEGLQDGEIVLVESRREESGAE